MIDTREKFADVFEINDTDLRFTLEERQGIIKRFNDEMSSVIALLRNYTSELKYMVDNKLDVSAITHLTFGADSHLLNIFPLMYDYHECVVKYLLDDNYQRNHDYWNELKNLAEELIKHMNRVQDQRLYFDPYDPAYDFLEHRITKEGLSHSGFDNCTIDLLKEIHHSRYTGMDLMNVLYVALSHIRDLMADIKDNFNSYDNDTLSTIYDLNYKLYVSAYWPERQEGFRKHIYCQIQTGDDLEDYLYEQRRREKLNFEGNSLGTLWRDLEHDKSKLALELKNKNLSDEMWKNYFGSIKRFDEYDFWIEELKNPESTIKEYPESAWDKIFKDVIDVKKVKVIMPTLLSNNISKANCFVIHKVWEEIDWLQDTIDTHFISWVADVYGWNYSSNHFKDINSSLKDSHSLDWNARTMTSAKISLGYCDLASKIRNEFVLKSDGKNVKADNKYYFKKPELYIEHRNWS
jgi:hypothetical protein